jgi:hypothetical protein
VAQSTATCNTAVACKWRNSNCAAINKAGNRICITCPASLNTQQCSVPLISATEPCRRLTTAVLAAALYVLLLYHATCCYVMLCMRCFCYWRCAELTLDVYYNAATSGSAPPGVTAFPMGFSTNPEVPTMIIPLENTRLSGTSHQGQTASRLTEPNRGASLL